MLEASRRSSLVHQVSYFEIPLYLKESSLNLTKVIGICKLLNTVHDGPSLVIEIARVLISLKVFKNFLFL